MRGKAWAAAAAGAVIVALLAFAVVACGGNGGSSPSSSSTAAAGTPVQGGTLTVAHDGEPTGLDPALAWEVDSWAMERLCYQGLLTYADKPGLAGTELAPCLATQVPTAANGGVSADGKVYTFHLRSGVKFAAPVNRVVTASDFKYSFERMLSVPEAPATFFYANIVGAQAYMDKKAKEVSGYQVVDPNTVRITLTKPDASFLYAMTLPFTSVVPKEWVQKEGKNFIRNPLGTGPFVFDHWTAGQEVVMKRNPNYWEAGKPYLDEVDFTFTANPTTQVLKLESGSIDLMEDIVPSADLPRIKADPTWSKQIVSAPQIAWYYVFMNTEVKPFDNVQVRQAVNYAIDRKKIARLLAGQGEPLDQVFPNGMPGHENGKTYYGYDPAKAKQLLAAAGYPNGFKTTFYSHNVDPFPKLAQAVQADLKAVGITVDIKLMDKATYWDYIALQKNRVPLGLCDWFMDFPDPSDWIGPLFTSASAVDNGENNAWWKNPQLDALYKASASELDPAKRIAMFTQMQQIIMSQSPTATLYQPLWNAFEGQHVGGFYIHPVWIFDFQNYWKTK